jgi:hypothetical protein
MPEGQGEAPREAGFDQEVSSSSSSSIRDEHDEEDEDYREEGRWSQAAIRSATAR